LSSTPGSEDTMGAAWRFVLMVLYFTAVLIVAVHLRAANKRVFYKVCSYRAQHSQVKQELWQKQLRLESLTNPAAISQRLDY